MTVQYKQELPEALARQFEEGHCLDLTILDRECKGHQLHRIMLTAMSAKVRLALDGVSIAGMLCGRNLPTDHDPNALILPEQSSYSIAAMLDFLYYGEYEEENTQLLGGHLDVYVLAQLLDFRQLKDHSGTKICEHIRQVTNEGGGIPAEGLTNFLSPLVDSLPFLYEYKIADLPQVHGSLEILFLFHGRSLWLIDRFQDLFHSGLGGGKFAEDVALKRTLYNRPQPPLPLREAMDGKEEANVEEVELIGSRQVRQPNHHRVALRAISKAYGKKRVREYCTCCALNQEQCPVDTGSAASQSFSSVHTGTRSWD